MSGLCRDCLNRFADPAPRCPKCRSARLIGHPELDTLTIAHIDCDAFYASVEKRDRPELRDRPVIVGGQVRGVVTTACYVARLSGVRSAMPMGQARRLCPEAIILPCDFSKYREASRRIFDKARTLTPLVQTLSLDEAWLDLAGTERLHGAVPAVSLARLQHEVERDIGVTISVGLAANRFLAKVASDMDKPRGFAVIGNADAQTVLASMPITVLPGVGPALAAALAEAGLRKVADLTAADPAALSRRFGSRGLWLVRLAQGLDSRRVDPGEARKSISAETTFAVDLHRLDDLENQLARLCDKVARIAREQSVAGMVATLKLRRSDFRTLTRRRTLPAATQTSAILFQQACALLTPEVGATAWRLIGVGLTELEPAQDGETLLFADAERRARRSEVLADELRRRFGVRAAVSGRLLDPVRRPPSGK